MKLVFSFPFIFIQFIIGTLELNGLMSQYKHRAIQYSTNMNNVERTTTPISIPNAGDFIINSCFIHDITLAAASDSALYFSSQLISATITKTVIQKVTYPVGSGACGGIFLDGMSILMDSCCVTDINTVPKTQSFGYLKAGNKVNLSFTSISGCSANSHTVMISVAMSYVTNINISKNSANAYSSGFSVSTPAAFRFQFNTIVGNLNKGQPQVIRFSSVLLKDNPDISYVNIRNNTATNSLFYCDTNLKIAHFYVIKSICPYIVSGSGTFTIENSVSDLMAMSGNVATVVALNCTLGITDESQIKTHMINHINTAGCQGIPSGGGPQTNPPTKVPTEVPIEPTEVPIEPTEVPIEPTEVPIDPTEVPIDPTDVPTKKFTAGLGSVFGMNRRKMGIAVSVSLFTYFVSIIV